MIILTQINDKEIVINSDLIECIEETPHTVITTVTKNKFIVKESAKDIIDKVIMYKATIEILIKGN
ncbi:MAG: flagellar FlbD family protein [Clostridia bacterium]|nr:flagellar FlbD family protein [Clostridia bacterium]